MMKKIYKPIARLFIPGRSGCKTAFIETKYKESDSTKIKKIKLSTMYGVFGKNEN